MSKQSFITILLTMLMSMTGAKAFAHDIAVANDDGVTIYYVWTNDNTELAVSYCGSDYQAYSNEYTGNVVIPTSVDYNGKTYPVTSIGSYAFSKCSLTSVTIPNSVTSIGEGAFSRCTGLTSVTIPNSVTSIGEGAFSRCNGLSSVTMGNSVTSIGEQAFYWCSKLTSFTIPNSVTSIGSYAFYGCGDLASVTIGNNVTSIGYGAFFCCYKLASVTIPNSVTSIGNYAFYYCNNLTSITFGNSVTTIGSDAFYNCSGLTSITIPNSVITIGKSAFMGCSGLTSVTIPNSVTSIGNDAFSYCNRLTSIFCLNHEPPTCTQYYGNYTQFNSVNKSNCIVWVPKGCVAAYKAANGWKDFMNIKEIADGDVNSDGKVNQDDLRDLVEYIMGNKPNGVTEESANVNGDKKVNIADVVALTPLLK